MSGENANSEKAVSELPCQPSFATTGNKNALSVKHTFVHNLDVLQWREFLRKTSLEIKSLQCKKVKVSHAIPYSEGSDRKMLLLTSLARGHGMGQPAAPQHHGRSKASFLVHLSD